MLKEFLEKVFEKKQKVTENYEKKKCWRNVRQFQEQSLPKHLGKK